MKKAGLFFSVLLIVAAALCWPSLQNPCPWGRSFAVSRSHDQVVLAEVAVRDENHDIRNAAMAKVAEPGLLAKMALKAKDAGIRLSATGKLNDQEVLAKVALQDADTKVREAAVARLTVQSVLAEVAVRDENHDIRNAAMAKVAEPGLLAKMALEAKDAGIRLSATGKLNDQEVLAKVALQDADTKVREAAVARLTVQSVLTEVAVRDENHDIRNAAMAKVAEPGLLAKMALEAKDAGIRLSATGKLNDQEVLAKVALQDADTKVREAAVARLTVQSVLAEVAVWDENPDIRNAAVKSLRLSKQADLALLGNVAKVAGNEKVRSAADIRMEAIRRMAELERRMAEFRGAGALAQAAISDGDPVIRHAAVARLSDSSALARVAAESKDWGVRRVAIAKISDAALRRSLSEQLSAGVPQTGQEMSADIGNASAVVLLWVPPTPSDGFMMGSPASKKERGNDETQHAVVLTKGFWLGKTEVTQAQWETVMENNPSNFKGDELPVEQVSWGDAMAFCRKLTGRERAAGRLPEGYEYILPTEAQWEYACRAGSTGAYAGDLDAMAWYSSNSGGTTHPVGMKQPNAWGFYDMHGNVWEWCADWYGDYPGGSVTDPTGPSSGSYRVLRCGSWHDGVKYCRSDIRYRISPGFRSYYLGFRLALGSVR